MFKEREERKVKVDDHVGFSGEQAIGAMQRCVHVCTGRGMNRVAAATYGGMQSTTPLAQYKKESVQLFYVRQDKRKAIQPDQETHRTNYDKDVERALVSSVTFMRRSSSCIPVSRACTR